MVHLLSEFAEQWLSEHAPDIKPATFRLYEYAINKLRRYFKTILLKDITRIKYQKFINNLYEEGHSNKTIKLIHIVANLIFKTACKYEVLRDNPIVFAKIPKPKDIDSNSATKDMPKYLERNELKLFLKNVKSENDAYVHYPLFLTLAYTGLHRGELAALKWADIDFQLKTININKTLYVGKGGLKNYVLQSPKIKSSVRIIVITDNILHELSRLRNLQKKDRMLHRTSWHEENFVFTSPQYPGFPIHPNQIWSIMKRILKKSALNENLSPHSLRHTHTSLLAESGASLEAIMERLGHSDDTITRTIYLHITKKVKNETAQKFYELMLEP